jgi:multidrug resistance efflux pump
MSETATASDTAVQESPDRSKTQNQQQPDANNDPVRRVTKIVLYIVAFIFIWYILADRLAPWTDQARVQAYVIPIVPEVAGRVERIDVKQHELIKSGSALLEIDPVDYQLAVQQAEASLELAGQEIGADTAAVSAAQAKLVEAQANLDHVLVQSKRVFAVVEKGVLPKFEADKATAALETAKARVDSAQAELAKAKSRLGQKGESNPKIRSAITALKQAQRNLARTKIYAPSDGGVTNLIVDDGYYANKGSPVMTFVSVDDIWIQANFRENSIGNIQKGNTVDIALDAAPGKIFKGRVTSVGFAVKQDSGGAVGDLEKIKGDSGWLRDSQRFPVIIIFDDESAKGYRRMGGQADVQIYTGNNWVVNTLGWIWIRVLSWLSYIY